MEQNHINPCFCISLKAGSIILSVYDIVYGSAYIFRLRYLEYLQESFYEYFPEKLPNPTKSDLMFFMSRQGNYIAYIISGFSILLATNYLKNHFMWLAITCYVWIALRTFIVINLCIFCNALLDSGQNHFQRFGYEVLFNIFMNLYFMMVIAGFIRATRIELNNYRAIKPINIARNEHEEYLRSDKESKFNNATSYHYLSPGYYLNVRKNNEETAEVRATYKLRDSHIDDTLLQYVIANSKLGVVSEEEQSEMESETKRESLATLELGPSSSTVKMLKGESLSYIPSEMSVPSDWDMGSGVTDNHMFSQSQMTLEKNLPTPNIKSQSVTAMKQLNVNEVEKPNPKSAKTSAMKK